jgi:hypothetical protein
MSLIKKIKVGWFTPGSLPSSMRPARHRTIRRCRRPSRLRTCSCPPPRQLNPPPIDTSAPAVRPPDPDGGIRDLWHSASAVAKVAGAGELHGGRGGHARLGTTRKGKGPHRRRPREPHEPGGPSGSGATVGSVRVRGGEARVCAARGLPTQRRRERESMPPPRRESSRTRSIFILLAHSM